MKNGCNKSGFFYFLVVILVSMAKDEYLAEVGLCFSSRSVGRIFLRKETCKSFFQAQDLLLLRVIYRYVDCAEGLV